MLGLPDTIGACLFDLDGVLTRTAAQHATAWKEMFDDFLRRWSERTGDPQQPFELPRDYDEYVDGKPRLSGVQSFLRSREIELALGSPEDPPDADTEQGLGNRKNELVLELIRSGGVEVFEGSVRYVEAVRDRGLRCAVVSSSKNCREVLVAARIDHRFDAVIDGAVAEREGLPGKPAPDTFLAGARALQTDAPRAAVFEDALAGVEAGRAGNFVVVADLAELLQAP